jgi:hypothetical protein
MRGKSCGNSRSTCRQSARASFFRRQCPKILPHPTLTQAWQRGQADAESIKRVDQLIAEGTHPLHALYTNATNLIGIFMEGLVEFPFLHRVCRTIKTEEEKYMASYPPMSPITVSFYMHWILYDVTFGPDRETVAEWFLGVCDLLETDPLEMEAVRQLCESRIGIFEARPGREGKHLLRELVTNREIEVLIPSGYAGTETALIYSSDTSITARIESS